jgi:hypothetical protein
MIDLEDIISLQNRILKTNHLNPVLEDNLGPVFNQETAKSPPLKNDDKANETNADSDMFGLDKERSQQHEHLLRSSNLESQIQPKPEKNIKTSGTAHVFVLLIFRYFQSIHVQTFAIFFCLVQRR